MATWTDIPDEVLEPGKPTRSVDALALRDNAIAIAEGAPDAPMVNNFEQIFTASGSFVAPKTGTYLVDIVGGGGRGGDASVSGSQSRSLGGGGSAGRWVSLAMQLTEGQTYAAVVGGPGGISTFNNLSAPPGAGGESNAIVSVGSVAYSGEAGAFGNIVANSGSVSGGVTGGKGGAGYGGGGGGAARISIGSSNGGLGAPGVIRIRW